MGTESEQQTFTQLEQKLKRMNASPADGRPTFRIASFGMAYKFQRLLEIVLRHARHNPYRFEIAGSRAPEDYDIAIVDMTVKGGPEVATTLRRSVEGRPIVRMGRRNDTARGTDDLLVDQFTIQLLRSLNRAAEGVKNLKLKGFYNAPNAPRSTTAIKASENAVADPVSLRPAKILALVIDDSQTVRRQLSLALHQMGIETEGVSGSQEALDVLSLRRYDLIFCDVMMPGGANGFELTKAIKRDRALKEVPLIILTSKSSSFDLLRGALAGCNSYLVKPVSLKALRETVVKNLRRSSRFDIHLEPMRKLA